MLHKPLKRAIILVADGLGVGEAPDAAEYGDQGANTLAHTARHVGGLSLPTLQKLGLGNIGNFAGIAAAQKPLALVGKMAEQSSGKDTTTGHWELAGLVTKKPFAVFPDGFPPKLVDEFVREAGLPGVLGNYSASGTVIISELGEEHARTGKPILYTSADSVFQIAANEDPKVFGLERLYQICEVARRVTAPYQIGRVIARPFVGTNKDNFKRTEHRRDYSLSPERNLLDVLQEASVPVYSVGKIDDIFAHRAISEGNHTGNNPDGLDASLEFLKAKRGERCLIFTNLVDFDQLYGHRRDPVGYAQSLVQLDRYLPNLLAELTDEDLLIITADHGCDPTFKGTDHTREYVPLIAYSPSQQGANLGARDSFADVAASLLEGFKLQSTALSGAGKSFLCKFGA